MTPALGHQWGQWTVEQEADCFHDGKETRTCATCSETESRIVPANAGNCPSKDFQDLDCTRWYHEGVDFMVRNTYMNGVSETIFSVNGKVTRGQVVTILYRVAGMPSVEGLENPFQDVSAGKFYTNAVTWAFNEGIVMGTSETIFAPDVSITREQIAAILYRYDGENTVKEDNLSDFSDGTNVSNFAKDAMNWAVTNGLINGIGTGETATLSAKTTATRSQIAVILMRYLTEG